MVQLGREQAEPVIIVACVEPHGTFKERVVVNVLLSNGHVRTVEVDNRIFGTWARSFARGDPKAAAGYAQIMLEERAYGPGGPG